MESDVHKDTVITEVKAQPPSTDEFIKGLWRDNPVFVQVLGMCPVLAVSNTAINALAMGLATAFVLLMSNILVSSLRNFIPKEVRIASYILIIATFVTITDYAIQAISVDLHKSLGAFISLIVWLQKILSAALSLRPLAWGWGSCWRCSAWVWCVRSLATERYLIIQYFQPVSRNGSS